MNKPKSFTIDDSSTEVDFRDSNEVWVWADLGDGEGLNTRLEFQRRDLEELLMNMDYLFRLEELGEMVNDMESDPMSDAVGYHPDVTENRVWLAKELVKRLDRQRHYIDLVTAKELVDEYLD